LSEGRGLISLIVRVGRKEKLKFGRNQATRIKRSFCERMIKHVSNLSKIFKNETYFSTHKTPNTPVSAVE